MIIVLRESKYMYNTTKNICKRKPWIAPTVLVLIFRLIFMQLFEPVTLCPDSWGYMEPEFHFIQGRTFGYRIIVYICRLLFGEDLFIGAVVIVQMIISIVGVVFFYKMCNVVTKNNKILFFATVLYGCSPAVFAWDNVILSESIALSCTVVFLYFILKYIVKPTVRCGVILVVLTFFMTFERPTFLLFYMLLFAFLVLRFILYKEERGILKKVLAAGVSGLIFIGVYSFVFYERYGIFTISDPLPRQLLIVSLDRGYYTASDNQEFLNEVKQYKSTAEDPNDSWPLMWNIIEKYGFADTQRIAKESIFKNIDLYVKDTIELMLNQTGEQFRGYAIKKTYENSVAQILNRLGNNILDTVSFFKLGHALILILAEFIAMIVQWVKRKKIPWIHGGIFAFMLLIYVSTYIATCDEYMRTMIHILPFMYLSVVLFLNWLTADAKLLLSGGSNHNCSLNDTQDSI